MINYELLLLIAIFAFVYSNILTAPEMIFNGIYNRLDMFFKTDERRDKGKGRHWLFMLIMHCERCIAGQMALWVTLFSNWGQYCCESGSNLITLIILHLLSVAFAIFCATIIRNTYYKYIQT